MTRPRWKHEETGITIQLLEGYLTFQPFSNSAARFQALRAYVFHLLEIMPEDVL